MEISTNYIELLQSRKPSGKATNRMQEIAWRYLENFSWKNETFFSDYMFFWMSCNRYWKSHTPDQFEKLLAWGAEREVHPRAIAKLLNET